MTILTDQQAQAIRTEAQVRWLQAMSEYQDPTETWNYLTCDWSQGDPITPIMDAAGVYIDNVDEVAEPLGMEVWAILEDEWEAHLC
jgi:hypothetical protein